MSLIGTFIFAKLFGFSINTLTLFGITLATGLVVDDAIVVIENVERHMEEGIADPAEATRVGMKEVTGAVIATSLVLIAVFVPVSFFPGTTGRLYQQFALTIAFSIALSAFNALTLSPALAALLLRPRRGRENMVFAFINKLIHKTTSGYVSLLHHLTNWRLAIIVLFFAGLGATGAEVVAVGDPHRDVLVRYDDRARYVDAVRVSFRESFDDRREVGARVDQHDVDPELT